MFKKLIVSLILICIAVFFINIGYYFIFPEVYKLKKDNPNKTAFMEYREIEWQKQGKKKKILKQWVSFAQISPYLVKAVIIAEDDKFWSHEGFDFKAMKAALEKDIKKKKFQSGGSTISQQLSKNLYLSPSKNPVRKIKEAILTWRIERNLSKRRIIELYLNIAEWGDGIFGIEAAARHYFGKHAAELTAMEAAKLASVLPNPRRFNPAGSAKYVVIRSEKIYDIMVRRGVVIEEFEEIMQNAVEPKSEEMPDDEEQSLNEQNDIDHAPKEYENTPDTDPNIEEPNKGEATTAN